MRPVTEKQIKFIARLVAERDTAVIEEQVQDARNAIMRQSFSSADASALIDSLLDQPRAAEEPTADDIEGGVYEDGDDLYRVYFGQKSGRMLAKQVEIDYDGSTTYHYAGAASRVLSAKARRLSVDEIGHLGVLTGQCLICGRRLDDPESVDRGIGPTCASKY